MSQHQPEPDDPEPAYDFTKQIRSNEDLVDRLRSGDVHALSSLVQAVTGVRVATSKPPGDPGFNLFDHYLAEHGHPPPTIGQILALPRRLALDENTGELYLYVPTEVLRTLHPNCKKLRD